MPEYGVFNDEGCLDSGYTTLDKAEASAVDFREQGDEYAKASEICPEHEEQPAEGCEECGDESCSNCGEPECEGWCDDCEGYSCEPDCTCNDWSDE
jgi:hypothetical protein